MVRYTKKMGDGTGTVLRQWCRLYAGNRYGIPILTKDEYYAKVDDVTIASAKKMIQGVFDTKDLFMVFYGDVDRIKPILQQTDPSIKVTVLDKEVLVQ